MCFPIVFPGKELINVAQNYCKISSISFCQFILLTGRWLSCECAHFQAETSQPIALPKAKHHHSQNVGFKKMRTDIDCPPFQVTGARGLVLRNHHAPLKRSGLSLILKHLKLKINPENADLSSCYLTKSITNSFYPQNWNFLLSPSFWPISSTLSSCPSVKYFQLDFTMNKGGRSWLYLCLCVLISISVIRINVTQYIGGYSC